MKKIFFFVAACSSMVLSQAQISSNPRTIPLSLTGRITDGETGQPLPGASIHFEDARIGSVADDSGNYIIRNVPAGHHLVEVSHAGFNTIVEHLDFSSSVTRDFALTHAIVENEGVTVTGVSNATSIRKAPIPVLAIRRAELLQAASTNIIDALAKEPGISQLSTGPGISKPVIRGLGYNRVIVVNDGAKQEGQQWGDEHGIEVDELSISKVEILKGPASLMYGSDALAGVINIITNSPVSQGTIRANILTNYQTNNGLFALHGNLAGNKQGYNWNIYGTRKAAGTYHNQYDGKVLNSAFNETNFGGYIGLNRSWGFSHLIFSAFGQDIGLVEGDRDESTGRFILYGGSPLERVATNDDLNERRPTVPMQEIRHYKIITDNNIAVAGSRLKINLGLQQNLRSEFGNPENPGEKELSFDLKTMHYNLQWSLPEKNHWRTTFGLGGMRQTNENLGLERIIPDYRIFDIGGFVYAQRSFETLTLSGGARFDNRPLNSEEFIEDGNLKFPSLSNSYSNFSGSAGISYEPTEALVFKANIARGFRAPNMAELASNGAHEGTNRFEYGDQGLDSETSLQFDGGVELNYEHFSFALSGFYNRVNGFIYYRSLSAAAGGDSLVDVDGEFIPAFRFDQHDAALTGLEAAFDLHPHPLDWLHFENTVSFVRGRFDEAVGGTENLPLIPAPRWISELRGNFVNTGKIARNIYFRVEADRTFEQDNPFFAYNTETSTPGYVLYNAGAGFDIASKNQTILSIHLAANNLGNISYQSHLSRLKYTDTNQTTGRRGVFNMGRNFSIKVNISLGGRI